MTNLQPNAAAEKCEGIGCAYKQRCGRFMRPSAGQEQKWGSWYAIAEDDCAAYEPLMVNGFHGHKEVE